jgi:hypothetical protein
MQPQDPPAFLARAQQITGLGVTAWEPLEGFAAVANAGAGNTASPAAAADGAGSRATPSAGSPYLVASVATALLAALLGLWVTQAS